MSKLIKNKLAFIGLIMIVIVCVICIGAPLFTSYDPAEIDLSSKYESPSNDHILGTDSLGRDVWTRLIYGGRMSILIGVSSALLAAFIGTALGCVSGYFGGKMDWMLLYISEIFSCFPLVLVVLVFAAFLGNGVVYLILIFSLTG